MSYHLAVYVSRPAEPAELLETVTGIPDLRSMDLARRPMTRWSSSEARARYGFTVGGPFRVEAEDVPQKDQRIAEIDLRWYVQTEKLDAASAAAYVELVRKFLPEALPRRFGDLSRSSTGRPTWAMTVSIQLGAVHLPHGSSQRPGRTSFRTAC